MIDSGRSQEGSLAWRPDEGLAGLVLQPMEPQPCPVSRLFPEGCLPLGTPNAFPQGAGPQLGPSPPAVPITDSEAAGQPGMQGTECGDGQPCPFPAGWSWASRLTSLRFACPVCGVGAAAGVIERRGPCGWYECPSERQACRSVPPGVQRSSNPLEMGHPGRNLPHSTMADRRASE